MIIITIIIIIIIFDCLIGQLRKQLRSSPAIFMFSGRQTNKFQSKSQREGERKAKKRTFASSVCCVHFCILRHSTPQTHLFHILSDDERFVVWKWAERKLYNEQFHLTQVESHPKWPTYNCWSRWLVEGKTLTVSSMKVELHCSQQIVHANEPWSMRERGDIFEQFDSKCDLLFSGKPACCLKEEERRPNKLTRTLVKKLTQMFF